MTMKQTRSGRKYWTEINGRLYARLQYKDEAGKLKVKYRAIPDKRSARAAVDDLRRQLETYGEELFSAERMTFASLLDKYQATELVEARFQGGVKVTGRRGVGSVRSAANHLRDHFGQKRLQNIKAADIKCYKNLRLDTPIQTWVNTKEEQVDEDTGAIKIVKRKTLRIRERKIASVNRELELLRAIFNFAVMNEWLVKSPFVLLKGVISKAAETERDRVLSFEEEKKLLSVCVGRRAHLRPILICALDTAMRRGEIFKMKWKDVDFVTNEINIPQTNTKTETARSVGITERLKGELQKLWNESASNLDAVVFGVTNTIKTSFGAACEEAKLENFRFHDCRHTATTRMIASGSPHTEVMKVTGHTQLKTFLRYLNITPETTKRVANNLHVYLSEQEIIHPDHSEPSWSN